MVMPMPQAFATADDLARMPDDGVSYELVEGRLLRMSKPGAIHGLCSGRAYRTVAEYVEAHGLGIVFPQDCGFQLRWRPDTVRAPDVAFVSRARIPAAAPPEGFWPGAPDPAAEVISPNDRGSAVDEKAREWLANGAAFVWVVDVRRRTVSVRRGDGTRTTLEEWQELDGEDVLPGFRLPLAQLFQNLGSPFGVEQ